MPIEDFYKYRGDWLLWRDLGHLDEYGSWVAPASFMEATQMPKAMLDTFFLLDDWIYKLMKQENKQK